MKTSIPHWLQLAREIQALSQTGISYSTDEYNTARYQRFMEIAAEIVHGYCGLSKEPLLRDFLAQTGYATPKVDVRGAIIQMDRILLVQERSDQRWCMPGGWADVGETPSEMVIREVWEESGYKVAVKKVIGILDANRSDSVPLEFFHAYKIIFLCEITGGQARAGDETLSVNYFERDSLPPLSLQRTNEKHVREAFAHVEDPDRPALFD
jgi:ADP-ribose pyrophosphatase YjhB (NUDIX family)